MTADDRTPCVARPPASAILTLQDKRVPCHEEKFLRNFGVGNYRKHRYSTLYAF